MVENVIQTNGGITMNVNVSEKHNICEKEYIWNPAICSCENGKYLANIMDNSVITYDEITEPYYEETKLFHQILMKKI